MKATIYITGEIGVETTLLDVVKQVKQNPSATELFVKIDSIGGFVEDGQDIYNYLKNLDKKITTYTTKAYSIASMIFMAGDERIIPENAQDALMIHLPWMEAQGNHSQIQEYLKGLKNVEDELVNFYSESIGIDENTIHSLLANETFLNAEEAKNLGFATSLQPAQLAVAKLHNEKEKETLMNKVMNKLDNILNVLKGKKVKAELVIQDATGIDLVFPNLESTDEPFIDDEMMVDGQNAEGEYLLPDGKKITAENGIVTQIEIPTDEAPEGDETEQTEEPTDALNQEEQNNEDSIDESTEMMLKVLEELTAKVNDLEAQNKALAKQIGSDFKVENTNPNSAIKAVNKNEKTFSIKRK